MGGMCVCDVYVCVGFVNECDLCVVVRACESILAPVTPDQQIIV